MVAMKFYFSPTEKNLLISYWYDIRHFRRLRPDMTMDEYLDSRVQMIKREMADVDTSAKSRQLNGDLLLALRNKRIRAIFISYLESPSPQEGYRQVAAGIRGVWRMDEEGGEAVKKVLTTREADKEPAAKERSGCNAKAYVIAAQLYYELEGKGLEFDSVSRNMTELTQFVREQFGVEKLPGTFEKFKGYSYEPILKAKKDRSDPKKGQLKVPFRQIRDHPEVFGEAVAKRAGEIYDQFLA
jgi:hypothetical protein